jgi:hypothetical protein
MCDTDGVMTGTQRRAAVLVVLFTALSPGNAQSNGQQEAVVQLQPDAIPTNEVLNYQVEWRLIPAGTARLTWSGTQLSLHVESTGLVSRMFRVEDDYRAALTRNLCVQNSSMTAHEGTRNRETQVKYDAESRKASYVEKDLNKNTTASQQVDIPPCVHDVLGGLMVLRTLHLEPGNNAQIPVSDGKKFVQIRVESQRREEVITAMGPKKTIRYEIFLFNGALYKRPGHLHVWLTDDNQRLPVQLQIRLQFTIGTITLKLEKDNTA